MENTYNILCRGVNGAAPDTDTLTVAQATILGYTIAAKTSVETFR